MRWAILAACVLAGVGQAEAQVYIGGGATPGKGAVEIGGGVMWSPGFEVGSITAELTRSGQQAEPFDLFTSDGEVNGFPGLHARVGFFVSDAVSVEGGFRWAKPELSYRLTADAESAPDETAVETLSHYVFDGSVLFHFTTASFGGGRGLPFVSGGAGYVRELHEGNELVETGNEIHVTGGIKYWFGSRRSRLGLRVEAGLSSREKGFDKTEGRRTLPLVLAGVTYVF
jgi:hypothetical protein